MKLSLEARLAGRSGAELGSEVTDGLPWIHRWHWNWDRKWREVRKQNSQWKVHPEIRNSDVESDMLRNGSGTACYFCFNEPQLFGSLERDWRAFCLHSSPCWPGIGRRMFGCLPGITTGECERLSHLDTLSVAFLLSSSVCATCCHEGCCLLMKRCWAGKQSFKILRKASWGSLLLRRQRLCPLNKSVK